MRFNKEIYIECEKCGELGIKALETPSTKIWKAGFTGRKGFQFKPKRIITLSEKCEKCGAKT